MGRPCRQGRTGPKLLGASAWADWDKRSPWDVPVRHRSSVARHKKHGVSWSPNSRSTALCGLRKFPPSRTEGTVRTGFRKLLFASQLGAALVVALCHETASDAQSVPSLRQERPCRTRPWLFRSFPPKLANPKCARPVELRASPLLSYTLVVEATKTQSVNFQIRAYRLLGPSLDATAANSIAFPTANHLQRISKA